jgi:hypothetical protein
MEIDASLQTENRLRHVLLMEELLQIIIYSNTKTFLNFQVYLECLHLLLNLLSTQMFTIPSTSNNQLQKLDLFWFLLLDDFSHFANGLVVRLIRNFIEQQPPPSEAQPNGLFMTALNFLVGKSVGENPSPIADHSINLLLIISSQCFQNISPSFKEAIGKFETANDSALSPTIDEGPKDDTHISFKRIYNQIAKSLDKDENVVLLYLLLIRNDYFRIYFLSRTDPEEMVSSIKYFRIS